MSDFLLVASCSLIFAGCSLVFARCSLLFARCSLVSACCSLLFAGCSLLFAGCSLLFARCPLLFARCSLLFSSLLVTFYSLLVTFCSLFVIFLFKQLWNKIIVNRRKLVWLKRNSATDIFLANLWNFGYFFWMMVFKVFSTCKTICKVDIKSQILPELISLWCLSYNIWTRFYLLLCTWRVRSSRPEEFYKKGVLKYSTKFTGKHLRWDLFCNKVAAWRPATSLNTKSGAGAYLRVSWNLL